MSKGQASKQNDGIQFDTPRNRVELTRLITGMLHADRQYDIPSASMTKDPEGHKMMVLAIRDVTPRGLPDGKNGKL